MEIINYTQTNKSEVINKAVYILQEGGLVVFPTETCYGIAADATNQEAIDKLFNYKSRREGKPLSIAVNDMNMANKYVEINDIAKNLYQNYLPGPITVVSNSLSQVAEGIESEYGTLGIRIPDYQLILDIIQTLNKPITATSANMSYLPKPYSIKNLLKDTPHKQQELIDLIIDAGELEHRETSTVVDTTMNDVNIMREGGINLDKNKDQILHAQTTTPQETINFGGINMLKYINKDALAQGPLVFFLSGELGAGKTRLCKGMAGKLGINKIIKSPTFTILAEYDYSLSDKTQGKFVHIDTWRVDSVQDLETVEIDSYLKTGNVIAIEWANKYMEKLQDKIEQAGGRIVHIVFKHIDETKRDIKTYE